ncbi:hypothetical protein F1880_006806 [Penicillium rolfsii]|nr:hypothetical protein F1880_006806 [Penicillium rolfsii]
MKPSSFAGVVITASGNIPGQTHESIQRMVMECGARFERLKVSDCTHLVTTKRCVKNATRKIDAAQKNSNCEVVDIKWLVDSVLNKHPVSTDSYLLKSTPNNVPGYSQLIESSPGRHTSNKRKFEADTVIDTVEEPPKRPSSELNAYTPEYSVLMHRLQILYNFKTDKYFTWFRLADDKTEEGELHGNGDLKSAVVEFKKVFKRHTSLGWQNRYLLPHVMPWHSADEIPCLVIQPPTKDEQQIIAQGYEKSEVTIKITDAVMGLLKLLFGHTNKMAIQYFFNEIANCRVKAIGNVHLGEDALQTAIVILDKLAHTLTENEKRKATRSSLNSKFALARAKYLKECYFGLLGIAGRSFSELPATDPDWLRREREDVHLLLKLRIAVNRASRFYNNTIAPRVQQAFQTLGLAEIKKVRKGSQEYKGLYDYLYSSVGSLHTAQYKEVISIFRIERRGESERYHKWRSANSDKIGQRCLLWHGSGCEKFIGILSQGLRVGLVEKSAGGMFGAGIYFADMSGKAARYCRGPSNMALMLLCEVEIGHDPLIRDNCDCSAVSTLHAEGKIAVMAHGRSNHTGWKNAKIIHRRLDGIYMPDVKLPREHRPSKTLAYNEYVVYNPAQIQQRYLFHLKTG